VDSHDFWFEKHDLLGIIVEVYIDDIVVKLAGLNSHLADLKLAYEKCVGMV
jgi:hypothetical protein